VLDSPQMERVIQVEARMVRSGYGKLQLRNELLFYLKILELD
jgi:hypothetical protein